MIIAFCILYFFFSLFWVLNPSPLPPHPPKQHKKKKSTIHTILKEKNGVTPTDLAKLAIHDELQKKDSSFFHVMLVMIPFFSSSLGLLVGVCVGGDLETGMAVDGVCFILFIVLIVLILMFLHPFFLFPYPFPSPFPSPLFPPVNQKMDKKLSRGLV